MHYIKVASVKKKVKQYNKKASKSFLIALEVKVDQIIEKAVKNANKFKTLKGEDVI
jgi:histone H3/H4